jgi:hypothetical protein
MDKFTVTLASAAVIIVGLGIYSYSQRQEATSLKTSIVEKERTISELTQKYTEQLNINKNIKSHTTVVVKKPDGTVITKDTTTEDKSTVAKVSQSDTNVVQSMTKMSTQSSEKTTQVKPSMTKYSLFVNTTPTPSYRVPHLGVGMRLATTPLWLHVEGGLDREFRVGARVDF